MPLPDADPDKRMYKLLKNIDLENLTFEQFQSTAQTVFAEPESEDTLRRIVLINLSRMAVAGDWNGLTTAGGGSDYNVILPEDFGDTGYVRYVVNSYPPWGGTTTTSQNFSTSTLYDRCYFYPFIAPESGVVAEMGIEFIVASSEANDIQVGIYSTTAITGAPDTLLGKGVFDSESTGAVYDTSLSSTVTLVKGTMYWIGICRSTTGINVTFRGISKAYAAAACPWNAPNINGKCGTLRLDNEDLSLPAGSITLTDFIPNDLDNPAVSLKIT